MDLKFKSKSWIENIYQKFEAMCQEVDDFVSQDTVKYVENQVQTVGENVKKICSDVVQDLLPPLVDPVKGEAQAVPQKQNDAIGTYISSMIGIEEKLEYVDKKQSSVEQDPFDPLKNCHASTFSGLSPVKQFIPPPTADPIKKAESDLLLGQDDDALICTNSDMVVEGNIMEEEQSSSVELSSPEDKDSYEASLSSNSNDGDHKNEILAKVSPKTLIYGADLRSSQKKGTLRNSFIDEVEYVANEAESDVLLGQDDDALICKNSDMVVEGNIMEQEQSPSELLSSPEDKDSYEASLFSESNDEDHKNEILARVSPKTLIYGADLRSSQKEGTVFNSFIDEVEYVYNVSNTPRRSELVISIVSCENKAAETTLISSSSSLSSETYNLSEISHANFPQKAEKICYNPTDAIGCVSDLSGALSSSKSFPTVAGDNFIADMGLTFSSSVWSLESNDVDTSRTDEAVSVAGSSGNKHEQCCECTQLEAFTSSFDFGRADDSNIDITDPSMETIDLSDKVKLDESCVIVDPKLLYAFSCKARKLRSYKKIIQDAFASKKRLAKEYEQLAIWYGDIDMESSHYPEQNLLPSIYNMSLESKKSPSHDLCDSEWELL